MMEHHTGSPLLDELAATHDEIMARFWARPTLAPLPTTSMPPLATLNQSASEESPGGPRIPVVVVRPLNPAPEVPSSPQLPFPTVFSPLPKPHIKPLEQRVAEARSLRKTLPKKMVDRIILIIRRSDEDCVCLPEISFPGRPKIEDIQKLVASRFNASLGDILSARKTANVVRQRQIAMYLSRLLTPRSLPEIGRLFGGRDHTTVLYAVRKIARLVEEDEGFAAEIAALREMLLP